MSLSLGLRFAFWTENFPSYRSFIGPLCYASSLRMQVSEILDKFQQTPSKIVQLLPFWKGCIRWPAPVWRNLFVMMITFKEWAKMFERDCFQFSPLNGHFIEVGWLFLLRFYHVHYHADWSRQLLPLWVFAVRWLFSLLQREYRSLQCRVLNSPRIVSRMETIVLVIRTASSRRLD